MTGAAGGCGQAPVDSLVCHRLLQQFAQRALRLADRIFD